MFRHRWRACVEWVAVAGDQWQRVDRRFVALLEQFQLAKHGIYLVDRVGGYDNLLVFEMKLLDVGQKRGAVEKGFPASSVHLHQIDGSAGSKLHIDESHVALLVLGEVVIRVVYYEIINLNNHSVRS